MVAEIQSLCTACEDTIGFKHFEKHFCPFYKGQTDLTYYPAIYLKENTHVYKKRLAYKCV